MFLIGRDVSDTKAPESVPEKHPWYVCKWLCETLYHCKM